MHGWLSFDSFGALLTPGHRHVCQAVRDKSSTILSIRRPTSTSSDSPLLVFIIRKTLNQRSLLFDAPRQPLGDCIAWFGCANDLRLQLRLLSPTAGSPEVLVGMLDEDRRDNAKGGLASDH
jgi:hypothetical protein